MAGKIVVGFDGGEQSQDALALARRLAGALEADLEVAAVLDYSPLPIDTEPYEEALREHFDQVFARAARLASGDSFTQHRLTGSSPAAQLAELGRRCEARLIVIGSTHRSVLGRVYPGTVGDSLLSGGPCAVAVAPKGYREATAGVELVGCGYDARPEADEALPVADALALAFGAELELISVCSYRPALASEFAAPLEPRALERERIAVGVAGARERIRSKLPASEIVDGDPAEVLIDRSSDLDLLVLGSRGYGPLRRTFLGGVSARVIREARCPVVVNPRHSAGWTAEDAEGEVAEAR